MNRHSSRIWKLKKELVELDRLINRLYLDRTEIFRVLHRANRKHDLGELSYNQYSEIWDESLHGYSVEKLVDKYDSQIKSLENKKGILKSEINETKRHEEISSKALSLSLSLLLVFGVITGLSLFRTELGDITGAAVTTEKVIIQAYYAIQMSNNSIEFGSLDHGTENNPAIMNKEGISASEYYVELSNDSNVPIKLNISAEGHLTNGSNIIGVGNMSWDSSNESNANIPNVGNETKLSTNPVISTPNFKLWYNSANGNKAYYRFWIDIPSGTTPGNYMNNITFEAYESS